MGLIFPACATASRGRSSDASSDSSFGGDTLRALGRVGGSLLQNRCPLDAEPLREAFMGRHGVVANIAMDADIAAAIAISSLGSTFFTRFRRKRSNNRKFSRTRTPGITAAIFG